MGSSNKRKIYQFLIILTILILNIYHNKAVVFATDEIVEISAETIQDSIVSVYSGILVDNEFIKFKNGVGTVISNSDNNTYIIIGYDDLKVDDNEIKEYCKAKGIDLNSSIQNSIQVVMKGDVYTQATLLTESKEERYSIIQTGLKIDSKVPAAFADSSQVGINKKVYTVTFDEDSGCKLNGGSIISNAAEKNDTTYFLHSAKVSGENVGAVLFDASGHMIAVNNPSLSIDDEGMYYSLPSNELKEILNSYQITYEMIKEKSGFAALTLQRKVEIILGCILLLELVWLIRLIVWRQRQKKRSGKEYADLDSNLGADGTVNMSLDKCLNKSNNRSQLVREKTGETFNINNSLTRIGQKEDNDIAITDNRLVSRYHAHIYLEDNRLWIEDQGSTNGTYINGESILKKRAYAINDGDTIQFADELFTLKEI